MLKRSLEKRGEIRSMTKKVSRCVHRHSIETHPNCFRKGLIKRNDWWHNKTIAYLDIEATNLDANWGLMLSWCLKYRDDKKVRRGIITKKELFNGTFDKRITKELLEELENVDIVVTFYGTRFDIKFVRTRATYWGMEPEFPAYGELYHWDLYFKVRSKYKLSSNRLGVVCDFFGIKGKTKLDPEVLIKARFGDKAALKNILIHNIRDVEILEKLHNILWRHAKWIRTSI